jgi:DNA-directed RNA polymerase subunit beta
MQSLGLNVEVLDDTGRVVVLKDEEFESDRAAEELGINLSRNEQLSAETDFNTYQ